MDRSFRDKWVRALRSGQYQQGRFVLRSERNAYCCLGVACDLVFPSGKWEYIADRSCYTFIYDDSSSFSSIPPSLADLMGLTANDQAALIHCNDGLQYSFEQIADWIERYCDE